MAYIPTMNTAVDRLAFFHVLESLKTQKRTGWIKSKVPNPESIADHMHRMSILALCTSDTSLDISKCVMMAVVHDLAEAVVGDIAPWEGVSKAEKVQREREGMRNMLSDMLHDGPGAIRIQELWEEYEAQATPEARFVKDLDRLEMALQAAEYEKHFPDEPKKLQPFFDSSIPNIKHPEVSQWGRDLEDERAKTRVT
ncbi:HD domain-containing protein 2 OS=Danio rerio GN=hddc2 PE=2 SV=1 [Rhizoctonia solani AG-1 IB]|uniref:5'-deoxynucleotidase n=1 Tax=Thanatephorus cucumeris (strain AG1-IB / isolate 7/3/14) TaxID=1108050 RepID=A0A0B7G0B4_THACB|nr:HD domain-containing protein 2 OS=Danio rerio GN=hddc2 PE=2 SV=1 [Rhizoctonia solani AG-1 IB]